MATAIVSIVVGKLESIAGKQAGEEFRLLVGVKKEAEKLRTTLELIEAYVRDAEVKQVHREGVKVWMQKFEHVMYDADDVLEDWFIGASISQSATQGTGNGIMNKVFSYLSPLSSCIQPVFICIFGDNFQSIDVQYDIAHRIKDIVDRLDDLIRNRDRLKLIPNQRQEENSHSQRSTISVVDNVSEICGRDLDRNIVISRLQGESSKQEDRVHVISIVGMGGLGKTTLAQIIYNEETIKSTFDLRMWVCVSEPFDRQRVAKEILEQAGGNANIHGVGSETVNQRLQDCVKEKQFLLVLDDVWSRNPNDWNNLKPSLNSGKQGSRIIVTTRDEQVANMMDSTYAHKLGQLSEDYSRILFWNIVLSGRSKEAFQSFEGAGEDILKKCKGLPLAIKTIASLMRVSETIEDWRDVSVNEVWNVQFLEENILPALLLSYYGLPPYLKPCFTYCATFPKDSRLKMNELVQLWMAQGYLGLDEEKELEKIGVGFFKDLTRRSFFQDFRFDEDGINGTCKMHDLVHDLAHFLTKTVTVVLGSDDIEPGCNHFLHINADQEESSHIFKGRNLRSLMIRPSKPALAEMCSLLKHLRVLSLTRACLSEVPNEIGKLLHLCYLDFSNNYELKFLPETTCNLTNLQTLKLNGCCILHELPERIGELSKLRHLEITGTTGLRHLPQSLGKLSRLRTLSKFVVNKGSEGCSVGELGTLNHLGGILILVELRNVQNVEEANQAELKKKKKLECLEFYFEYKHNDQAEVEQDYGKHVDNRDDIKTMEDVLEGFEPNESLKRLVIEGYRGFTFPLWMSRELPLSHVVDLTLEICYNCIELPALGCLKSLETLFLQNFMALKHIGHEFYGAGGGTSFPKLKKLTFYNMTLWEDWQIPFINFEKVMPCLVELQVERCNKLKGLPALGRLESLEIIELKMLGAMKLVGEEFLGISSRKSQTPTDGGRVYEHNQQEEVIFPKLHTLIFQGIWEWEEWDFPIMLFQQKVPKLNIMPQLSYLVLHDCTELRAVPAALAKLQSLERLHLENLPSVEHLSVDIFGIPGGSTAAAANTGESTSIPDAVLFPRLTELCVSRLKRWEGNEDEGIMKIGTAHNIMPCLKELGIGNLPRLKVIPYQMFSLSLRKLSIMLCPALTGPQPCLPPLLEHLELKRDIGVLSKSVIPIVKGNTYHNLKYLLIASSQHSSLPEGLSKFKSLQKLEIRGCVNIDFKPEEELRHFPMLQKLDIMRCPILSQHYNREDWSNNLSQISYRIIINGKEIIGTRFPTLSLGMESTLKF